MPLKTVFTTGQVAQICKVSARTVSKWFDQGRLKGYRIPGGQDRRIPRDSLVRFLKEYGMPLGELEEQGRHKLLLVGVEPLLRDRLRGLLPEGEGFQVEVADGAFEAGALARTSRPDAVVIDLCVGRAAALQMAQNLRRKEGYQDALIIALACEDEPDPEGLTRHGFSEAFQKPFDVALLAERIRSVAEQEGDDS